MSNFHKNFPFGKGQWIWELKNCEDGDVDRIIAKCKKYNVSYVLIKSYDGENLYPSNAASQLTKEISDKFHANGISVYSWSFNYGYNIPREVALALYSLEQLGVDGHIFNAETVFENLPNPAESAKALLEPVRAKHPEAFLAHAPFAIIDYHTRFPYIEFGKYCDAVMPQMYFGTIGVSVERMVDWTYEQFSKWEKTWTESGNSDSVKPIIPISQGYDNSQTNFVMTATQVREFITRVAGYGSVNFWSFQHFLRTDLWEAFRDTGVKPKEEFISSQNSSQNVTPEVNSTSALSVPTPPVLEKPTDPAPITASGNSRGSTSSVDRVDDTPVETTPSTQVATVPVPDTGKTTVTVEKDDNHPAGVKIEIKSHKRHLDYLIDFLRSIFNTFTKKGNK